MQQLPISELADAIAAQMQTTDAHWHTEPTRAWPDAAFLISDDGHQIALIRTGRSVTARGFFPTEPRLRHGPSHPEITMADRSPQYICGHIRRRLMPRYEEALTAWRRLAAETVSEQAGRAATAARIASALGADRITADWSAQVHVTEETGHSPRTTVRRHPDTRADISGSGDTVNLTANNLTGEQAAAVCALLHQLTT
ncbi:hypothetical protein [Streptomyces sp. NBC_00306]|uniref:hypothetical protein n=1 Tax=Streptomyces sp. NBC_00306 TaxID=2975708 RepID=UPI002E2DA4F4|nr:hypothetical protein [Streptomyces sp. NBC_00306]